MEVKKGSLESPEVCHFSHAKSGEPHMSFETCGWVKVDELLDCINGYIVRSKKPKTTKYDRPKLYRNFGLLNRQENGQVLLSYIKLDGDSYRLEERAEMTTKDICSGTVYICAAWANEILRLFRQGIVEIKPFPNTGNRNRVMGIAWTGVQIDLERFDTFWKMCRD